MMTPTDLLSSLDTLEEALEAAKKHVPKEISRQVGFFTHYTLNEDYGRITKALATIRALRAELEKRLGSEPKQSQPGKPLSEELAVKIIAEAIESAFSSPGPSDAEYAATLAYRKLCQHAVILEKE